MTRKFYFRLLLLAVSLLGATLPSCKDAVSDNPALRLRFSTDTLRFDTTFTTIGSATLRMMVYNPNKEGLNISSVALANGSGSVFRFNLDGLAGANNSLTNIEISGHDSLYLFVEVRIDPNNSATPVLVSDQLQFVTNGNLQTVQLEAIGQDVEILRQTYLLNDTTLLGQKPYLVYDYLAIDTARTLTLAPGCRFYFHNAAQLIVFGTLQANGTLAAPITMQGDRIDYLFADVPYRYTAGQWAGIYLDNPDGHHKLNYVELRSAINGIYAHYAGVNNLPSIKISNCLIHNCSQYGLVLMNTDAEVTNTEISNCASYCVYTAGGTHNFVHSTVANFFGNTNVNIQSTTRDQVPAVCINDMPKGAPMSTTFSNCVVSGMQSTEWTLLSLFASRYDGHFTHCYLRTDSTGFTQYDHIRYYRAEDKMFKNTYFKLGEYADYDFRLDSLSPARGLADPAVANSYPIDRAGNNRMADGQPDAGAYEWQ